MTDNASTLRLLIEEFKAAVNDLSDHKELKEECDELIRMLGYDKKTPISMILTGFYMGFGKGRELERKLQALTADTPPIIADTSESGLTVSGS